jgi:hypothetical protein
MEGVVPQPRGRDVKSFDAKSETTLAERSDYGN